MDASNLPKGQSTERSDQINLPGIYVHKDTGEKFITAEGEAGVVQADALMSPIWKDAWEWKAEVPSRIELLAMRKTQEVKDAAAEALQKGQEAAELKAATKAAVEAAKAETKEEVTV